MSRGMNKDPVLKALIRLVQTSMVFGICWLCILAYRSWIDTCDVFQIQNVKIQGNSLLQSEELFRLGSIREGMSIWELDLKKSEKNLLGHPFLESVHMHRLFPNRLHIFVTEKEPMALLNVQNNLLCIDRDGLVLPATPGRLYDLPVLSGGFQGMVEVGHQAGGEYLKEGLRFLYQVFMERPQLYGQISEVVTGQPQGLILYTSQNGVPVWLGKDNYNRKLLYLEAILKELDEQEFFMARYIDLRFEGQVIVGMRI
jgi:cell division protein FtsQ